MKFAYAALIFMEVRGLIVAGPGLVVMWLQGGIWRWAIPVALLIGVALTVALGRLIGRITKE